MEDRLNVYQRIAEVVKEVPYVQKTANLGQFKALAADVVKKAFKSSMTKHGLIALPIKCEVTECADEKGKCRADIVVRFVSIDDANDFIDIPSTAYGKDNQAKEAGKAITMAHKYALIECFMAETGEKDPEFEVDTSASEMFDSYLAKVDRVEYLKGFGNAVVKCLTDEQKKRLREKIESLEESAQSEANVQGAAANSVGTEDEVRMVQKVFPNATVVESRSAKVETKLASVQERRGKK